MAFATPNGPFPRGYDVECVALEHKAMKRRRVNPHKCDAEALKSVLKNNVETFSTIVPEGLEIRLQPLLQ